MAKAKKTNTESFAETDAAFDAFDAFGGETVVEELDGTWKKEVGATIIGTISHAYEFVPKQSPASAAAYLPGQVAKKPVPGVALRTTIPCEGRQDGQQVTFPAGSLVGVTLDRKLEPILLYTTGSIVAIRIEGQADLANGGHTWRSTVKCDGKRRAGGNPLKAMQTDEQSDADDSVYHYEPDASA
jgi:hypothetical protein